MKKITLITLLISLCIITGCSKKSGDIGVEKAKELAFSHAGVNANEVTVVKAQKERDDRRNIYDIEFYSKDFTEYDCEVDAQSGEIISFDKDAESVNKIADKDAPTSNTNNSITAERAKEIALSKVEGATDKDIREFKRELEDGLEIFEGKIIFDKKEYEFEINAQNGEVIKWEID